MNRPDLIDAEFQDDWLAWERPIRPHTADGSAGPVFPDLVQGSAPLVISMVLSEAALAGADAIRLDLANLSPTGCLVGVTLNCRSPRTGSADGSYFSGVLEPLAVGASRSVLFPAEGMGLEGAPGPWANASSLEVTFALPKGSGFAGELSIALEGIHGLARRLPVGPRLQENGLARVICQPSESGDDSDGHRGNPLISAPPPDGPWIEPPLPAPLEDPGLLLDGTIMGRGTGFPPQWTGGPDHPHQWLHLLHRHHFLRPLAKQFADTRDPALAEATALVMVDWISNHPVPLGCGGGADPAWETLSTAWRLREWLTVVGVMMPSWDKRTQNLILRSLWEHARHLMDHRGHPTNWAVVEAAALALAGLAFPVFREAPLWPQTGLERLADEVERQFLPDGVHFELSPLYQAICLEAMLAVRRTALARGAALPPFLGKALERGLEYLRALRRPDGTWPALNDSWGIDGSYDALLALADRELGTRRRPRPTGTGRFFPHGGVCVLGDSPETTGGNRLVLRAGPAGAAHAHQDTLSLDVCLAGRPFAVDPGISGYDPGPLVGHYASVGAHCMPWVEGWERRADRLPWPQKIAQAHGDLAYAEAAGLEAAVAVAWGPWSRPEAACMIFRTVLSVTADYFVVCDHFCGEGVRRIRVGWQLAPGPAQLEAGGRGVCLHGPQGPVGRLDLLHAGSAAECEEAGCGLHMAQGWVAMAGKDVPAAYVSCDLMAELPRTLVWLLRPPTAGSWAPILRPGTGPGSLHLSLPLPGGHRDELELGPPKLARRAPGQLRLGSFGLTRHGPGRAVTRLCLA